MNRIVFSTLSLLFFISCGGGGGTATTITWSKVSNPCISDGGGYLLKYFTVGYDMGSDVSLSEIEENSYQSKIKEIPYTKLRDPNNPSTILKLKNGYTYFKVASKCTSGTSEYSIYSSIYIQ